MPNSNFVHLHVHSQYSLLDGACHLDQLVAKAKEYRMPALALTDHGNFFGAVDFYLAARAAEIKPILGVELYIAPRSRFERSGEDGTYEGANHATILVKDLKGYKNLLKLVTAGYLEGFYYKPRVDKELLAQYHEGLIMLSGCLNCETARLLAKGDEKKALDVAGWYRDIFGPENYFLEVQDHGMAEQRRVTQGILRLAKALDAPIIATNDVHYLNAPDSFAHEVLLCIQTGKTMKDPDRWRFAADQFFLKSPEEMGEVFGYELPEALKNTLAVAERCNLELPYGRLLLPRYPVPEGGTQESYLEKLACEGLKVRYPHPSQEVLDRLTYELEVIKKTGYASYFLVVWDFVRFAKGRGIAVGPGRGSAAGSLVAYCLGITNIDPIRYGLIFERFLNPERVSMPDMDIDFSDDRRDGVIEYVTERYGRENVSQIITFGTMGAKAVIRDVGRALGMPYGEVDRIAKMVPNVLNITLDEALVQSPPLQEAVNTRPEVQELWRIAKSLEGLTRHASTHAAGVVISSEPLIEHVPLYKGTKGEVTTQYAMGAIEKIGLLKMDFLGLRTLTVIANAVKLVAQTRGLTLDMDTIPLDDGKTFQLLWEARTVGIFQLESPGMRDLLKRLRPNRFEDLIAILALYRPGPMVLIDDFIARRHGRVKITYDHPLLEPILKDTYGIVIFQEQVMRMASDLAGFSMSEADVLRKAMGKKDPEMMAKQRRKFVEGAKARGIPEQKAEQLFDLISRFAGYAFNKPHSTAYAIVAYQTAYLKAHYPVEFMAALLSSEMNDTNKIVKCIEECRQMGIEVLPPDVNGSDHAFTVVQGKIRFGFVAVKNVGEAAIQSILTARRKGGPFHSLFDFCERADLRVVNKRVIESLIKAGAFDSLGVRRSHLMAVVDKAMEAATSSQKAKLNGQASLLDMLGAPEAPVQPGTLLPDTPEWSREERLAGEKEILGFYITGHPLADFQEAITRFSTAKTDELPLRKDKETVRLCAIVTAVKEITTRNGERMAFLTLEDLAGTVEAVAFPEVYRQHMLNLVKDAAILVRGQVDHVEETVKLLLTEVQPLTSLKRNGNQELAVSIPEARLTKEALGRLRALLEWHPGPAPVRLRIRIAEEQVTIACSPKLSIEPSDGFKQEIEELFGAGSVSIG
ncbi:MAG: DNA polymerase III subunit alpha [candidate division NC10 bacterium]|nr:DNA polymerase III subunit alpha [candidate division NC10 bacterium]